MKDLFNLGDIVALKSHPYATEHHKILVSGEPFLISPMMVIVEIFNDLQDTKALSYTLYLDTMTLQETIK